MIHMVYIICCNVMKIVVFRREASDHGGNGNINLIKFTCNRPVVLKTVIDNGCYLFISRILNQNMSLSRDELLDCVDKLYTFRDLYIDEHPISHAGQKRKMLKPKC